MRVQEAFDSYARYWLESFRLPHLSQRGRRAGLQRVDGYEHIVGGLRAGNGVILALPHLGGWEWAGRWIVDQGHGITVVVEQIEPPELFEWFVDLRVEARHARWSRSARRRRRAVIAALQRNHIVCLLSRPRHQAQPGPEVEFFGETHDVARRRRHAGAAHRRTDRCRRRCTSPTASTVTSAWVRPPIVVERESTTDSATTSTA